MTKQVFILGGARTPMTTHVGALKDFSAIDLGAIASRSALERRIAISAAESSRVGSGEPSAPKRKSAPSAPSSSATRAAAALASSPGPATR